MEYKMTLGYIATAIAFIGYVPYFINLFRGKTKPHIFSWAMWGLLNAIAFFAQVTSNGGAGSWVTGFTALACFSIAVLGFHYGEKVFSKFDWISLGGALLALLFWALTSDPLLSVILVTITDVISFLPTFRKGYYKPHEETVTTFALSVVKYTIALFALSSLTLTTWLFPLAMALMNLCFVILILVRRKVL